MKLNQIHSLKEIAKILDLPFEGSAAIEVSGINEIHRVNKGDIVFVDHPKYYEKVISSAASVILINNRDACSDKNKGYLISTNPFRDFNYLLNYFNPFEFSKEQIQPETKIGSGTQIHQSVSIGRNVSIGNNTLIFPNVSILDDVSIGDNVIIQSGTIIGSMGFYYKNRTTHHERLNSVGCVKIEDAVEIGANCTIDKGVTSTTFIGKGTKIDNLVQIGHDTIIGKHCIIASQSGIAGCVRIGDFCTIWGQVGIASGITIGDKTVLGAKSGVSKSLEGGKTYVGIPADEIKIKYKEQAALRSLTAQSNQVKENEQ
tara:strand:+ start:5032 stop:5976 length:945 start_codon:yes stop_codon:yes gene_type:complete